MIKIGYADLPGGLHVRAVTRGKDTVIYLLPGLTVEQRRAALRRVRSSARMGQGPPLTAVGLARAVIADRIMTTVRNVAGATRVHPGMFVPLIVILLSAAVACFVLSSVSIKIHSPQAGAPETLIGPAIATAAGPPHGSRSRDPGLPGGPAPLTEPLPFPVPVARPQPIVSRALAVSVLLPVPDRVGWQRAVRQRRPAGRVRVAVGSARPFKTAVLTRASMAGVSPSLADGHGNGADRRESPR